MKSRHYLNRLYVALSAFLCIFSAHAVDSPDDYDYTPMVEEGKAWHYTVCMNWWIGAYDDVKLVLQGDVERDGQIWKQCWFMTEDDKPLAKTPVVLLREENKIVYIYPIVNSSTFWDRSGKYSWDHSQIEYCMTYFKDYVDESGGLVDTQSSLYPEESPEAINEVYPAVLYDFNMKTGDSLDPLASSHWSWLHFDSEKLDVGDIQYESICSRTYKKISLMERETNWSYSAIFEGIGFIQKYPDDSYYHANSYFICPMPCFEEISGGGGPETLTPSLPELLYVTDKAGEVIFGSKKTPVSIGKTESENENLYYADGRLIISDSGSGLYSVIVYDMRGATLYKGSISADSPVSVSDKLLPGIYIAVAECGGSLCRLKFEVK